MSTDETQEPEDGEPQDQAADQLTDELAKKYDPERLLKIVSRRAGRGDPLEHSVRARYEKRFGVDLGHVRVYTGEFAEEFNRQRGAYAVTVGSTGMILMGGSPDKATGSASGEALLAHELTHVAQQARGLHRKATFDGAMPFAEEHELEADAVEREVESGGGGDGPSVGVDGQEPSHAASGGSAAQKNLLEQIEKIKQRVIELVGETARNQLLRNGSARRA